MNTTDTSTDTNVIMLDSHSGFLLQVLDWDSGDPMVLVDQSGGDWKDSWWMDRGRLVPVPLRLSSEDDE